MTKPRQGVNTRHEDNDFDAAHYLQKREDKVAKGMRLERRNPITGEPDSGGVECLVVENWENR
jgi:hypothetical protein